MKKIKKLTGFMWLSLITILVAQLGCSESILDSTIEQLPTTDTTSVSLNIDSFEDRVNLNLLGLDSLNYVPTLVFKSNFDGSIQVTNQSSSGASISGIDSNNINWLDNISKSEIIKNYSIQYQGGDSSMRLASVTTDPVDPSNQALRFSINESNVDGVKGRIQGNISTKTGLKGMIQSERIFIPQSMDSLNNYPNAIGWLTIAEFWNNITWSATTDYGFRITLGLGKPAGQVSQLSFIVDAEDYNKESTKSHKFEKLWSDVNSSIPVPVGRWFTLKIYIKEGDESSGRFVMAIQEDNEDPQIVFDITNYTHNSKDPDPNGITFFNPIKLYTGKPLIDYMRNAGEKLEIYWDDYELWKIDY